MRKLSTAPFRAAKKTERKGSKGKGKETRPGCFSIPLRPRARAGVKCTWREACKAADYVLEHFGDPRRDRGIWVWYCQRIGLDTFLDLADEIISSWNQREIRWPVRAFQRHLMDALPKEGVR